MTIEESKKLLPPELKYPLPDGVIDNLINVQAIPLQFDFEDENDNKGMHYAMMAALIELKERREQEDKEDEERALEIERDDWERESSDD